MSDKTRSRDALLSVEPLNAEMQQRFEQRMQELIEGKVSTWARFYWLVFMVVCLCQAVYCGWSASRMPSRGMAHVLVILCCLISAVGAGICGYVAIRGRIRVRNQVAVGRAMPAVAFLGVIVCIVYGTMNPEYASVMNWCVMCGVAVLILASSVNVWNRIASADLSGQEHLLRLEYRVAELAARIPPAGNTSQSTPD